MKAVNIIVKILIALAAIAGAIYVIATYGNQIVAWAKKLIGCGKKAECTCEDGDCICEEESCEEVPAQEGEVVAEDKDFEG